MNYINFVLIGVIVLLLLGFLIGFLRNWKKSLTRFIILLVCVLLSIFLAPVITNALVGNSVEGTTISIFSFHIDVGDLLSSLINNPDITNDLMGANETTNQLISALVRVVANLAVFLVMFLVLYLLSLLVYAIVFAILSSRRKKKGIKVEKNGKYWGLKTLSGFIGMVGMMFIAFVFMIPAFGVLKICSYLQTGDSGNTASAYSVQSYLGDSFQQQDNNNPVSTYIDKAVEIKKTYDDSFLGKSLNIFGISKLGELSFGYLTSVTVTNSSGSLRFDLCNELGSIIAVYNTYNEEFSNGKFDFSDNDDIENVKDLYDKAVKSEVLKKYLTELLPKLSQKWAAPDGKFLGISCPGGNYKDIVIDTIEIFDTNNIEEITTNVKALLDAVKVANNYQLLQALGEDGDIMKFFTKAENENFISEFVLKLVSTNKLKVATPNILSDFIGIAYDQIFETEHGLTIDKNTVENIEDWNAEALRIQNIINKLCQVNEKLFGEEQSGVSTVSFMDEIVTVGDILDNAKNSIILQKPLHQFMYNFIDQKVDLDSEIKAKILEAFGTLQQPSENWTNPQFSFKKLFETLFKTYETAKNLQDKLSDGSFEDLRDVIEDVIKDGAIKDTVQDLLNSNIVDQFIGEGNDDLKDLADTVTGIVDSVLGQTTEGMTDEELKEALDKDFKAGQNIFDAFTHDTGEDGQNHLFTDDNAADSFVESLQQSGAIRDYLEKQDSVEDSPFQDKLQQSLTGDDKTKLKESLEKNLNGEEDTALKQQLEKLFGLNG